MRWKSSSALSSSETCLPCLTDLIKYQFRSLLVIQYGFSSGIDVGGFRGSLNAATGTHEFGLGSVKEIIEAPVESSSVLLGLPEYKSPHGMAFLVGTTVLAVLLTSAAAKHMV